MARDIALKFDKSVKHSLYSLLFLCKLMLRFYVVLNVLKNICGRSNCRKIPCWYSFSTITKTIPEWNLMEGWPNMRQCVLIN